MYDNFFSIDSCSKLQIFHKVIILQCDQDKSCSFSVNYVHSKLIQILEKKTGITVCHKSFGRWSEMLGKVVVVRNFFMSFSL